MMKLSYLPFFLLGGALFASLFYDVLMLPESANIVKDYSPWLASHMTAVAVVTALMVFMPFLILPIYKHKKELG